MVLDDNFDEYTPLTKEESEILDILNNHQQKTLEERTSLESLFNFPTDTLLPNLEKFSVDIIELTTSMLRFGAKRYFDFRGVKYDSQYDKDGNLIYIERYRS